MAAHPNPAIERLIRPAYDLASFEPICSLLNASGTLRIPVLSSGLFAAATTTEFSSQINYHCTWVRDTVHVAHAHAVNGQSGVAVRAAAALCRFFATQQPRLRQIIADPALKHDAMRRPHIRFNGQTLKELQQTWPHAQNDALGYFLWLVASLAHGGHFQPGSEERELLALFSQYLESIEYWRDEESGHWEEVKKIAASSIGAVVAGLRAFKRVWPCPTVDRLLAEGEQALREILPAECLQPDPRKKREYDAALLFLIYPLNVVDDAMADRIIERTTANLLGRLGIKRYPGDSFYCTDYELQAARMGADPTGDFSEDLAARDALLGAGGEAQWCIFDSIISAIYGQRFLRRRLPEDLALQTRFLNRALRQITSDDPPRCGPMQCPELY
jgi:phosphorylase kinase alpha/beta subunit